MTSRDAAIKAQLDAFERHIGRRKPNVSRFDRLIIERNLLDRTVKVEGQAIVLEAGIVKPRPKNSFMPGEFKEDPQYSITVMFAKKTEDIYGQALVKPAPGVYQVRAEVTQHHAGQLFQGFKLEWVLPTGWSFAGGGAFTYHEFISNPTVATRLATYASGTKGWKVILREWYR